MEEWITSVGIDLGTSTTKWVLSRLRLSRTAEASALPRYDVVERRIEYASPMHMTPLNEGNELDLPAVAALFREEYEQAGVAPQEVQTGAVIITGETAAKRNAEELLHALSLQAGQFVAAAAGAELEALLAGKGSGAEGWSKSRDSVVANVDIGGGTANAVYYRKGKVMATATLHIGGRLIRVDGSGRVQYVSPALRGWAAKAGATLPGLGLEAAFEELRALCSRLALLLIRCISGEPDALEEAVPLFVGEPVRSLPRPDAIWVSGGIGSLMEKPEASGWNEAARYGDIGPLLAMALAELGEGLEELPAIHPAPQSSRATVIGAGTGTTSFSGATLYYSPGVLPIRNVPVVVCTLPSEQDGPLDPCLTPEAVKAAIHRGLEIYGKAGGEPPFALALRFSGYCSYRRLQQIAEALAEGYADPLLRESAVVVVCQSDMAKALGYALLGKLAEPQRNRLVCLDQLAPQEGDYIDAGQPLKEDVVPVVVKTLVFGG